MQIHLPLQRSGSILLHHKINLNRNRKQNFKDKKLKEKALQLQRINFRITEIELIDKNGKPYTEILISNLEKENSQ